MPKSCWRSETGALLAVVSMLALDVRAASTNTPPTIGGSPSTILAPDVNYTFVPAAIDADLDYLRFYIANKPAWATFDSRTGALTGTPSASQAGTYPDISIYVSDSKVSTFLPAFDLTVTDPATPDNQAPVISGAPIFIVPAGRVYFFLPNAIDADDDKLWFSISNKPAWAIFSISNGSLTGIPSAA
jgi:hypothetical protein